jgi:hypothetical protein
VKTKRSSAEQIVGVLKQSEVGSRCAGDRGGPASGHLGADVVSLEDAVPGLQMDKIVGQTAIFRLSNRKAYWTVRLQRRFNQHAISESSLRPTMSLRMAVLNWTASRFSMRVGWALMYVACDARKWG